jgi:glycosyltransferase involved in cell wall biosynthesis
MISVVIPAYEAKGKFRLLLTELFESLVRQIYRDFEIIVSDHSESTEVKEFCDSSPLEIRHFFCERDRGNASVNMNYGISKAEGDFIKIMHMDDFFKREDSLQLMANSLQKTGKKWGGFGFDHLRDNELYNVLVPSIKNAFGCPSVSFFAREDNYFDERLIIINDHDMHHRLYSKYGEPLVIEDICVTIRMHSDQVSQDPVVMSKLEEEWKIFNSK